MDPLLVTGALLIFLVGLVHSVLGERFILIRLFRRDLPELFGSDWFTKRTLRFAWHLTTIVWWGLGWLLLRLAGHDHLGRDEFLGAIIVVSLASGVIAAAATRGRHLSWVAFGGLALLCWLAMG